MKYRKKPVVIEALQFTSAMQWDEVFKFCPDARPRNGELYIKTLEGNMHVSAGDYIIKGVKGEFYPCKPDIFEPSYEPVDEDREAMLSKPVLKKQDGNLYLTPKALDEIDRHNELQS